MPYDPQRHDRRSLRLRYHDYARGGAYFVTLCTHRRRALFGAVVDGVMNPNGCGLIVRAEWERSEAVRVEVELGEFVVMPDHFHALVLIDDVGGRGSDGRFRSMAASLGSLIAGFKSAVTVRLNRLRGTPGEPVWQRNYYEHVVRGEADYRRIEGYIRDNPARWRGRRYGAHS